MLANQRILFFLFIFSLIFIYIIFYNNFIVYELEPAFSNGNDIGIRTPQDIEISDNVIFIGNMGSQSISVIDGSNDKLVKELFLSKIDEFFSADSMKYNSKTKILYVTGGMFRNLLIGINTDERGLVFDKLNISKSFFPLYDLDINLQSNNIYATNNNGIIVIDGSSNQVIKSIPIDGPNRIAVNEKTNKIYVTSNNKIVVIDEQNNYNITKLITFKAPNSLSLNKKTNIIYVFNEDANRLAIINGSTDNIQETLLIGKYTGEKTASDIALNEETNKIYLSDKNANSITIIDGSSNQVIKSIPIDGPNRIAVNEKTNKIYSITPLSDSISIIDGKKNERIFGKDPYNIKSGIELTNSSKGYEKTLGINEITNRIYVGQKNSIFVFDGKTDILIKKLELNQYTYEIHVDTSTNKIFIWDYDDKISIIDGNTYAILGPINFPLDDIYLDKINSLLYFLDDNNIITTIDINNNYSVSNSYNLSKINPTIFDDLSISNFAIDSKKNMIFLLDNNDRLIVIDYSEILIENKLRNIELINVGELAKKILINPFTSLVYVLNQNSDTISVIDEYTNELIKNITVGTFPISMDIDTKTNTIYVTNEHSDSVSIIDGHSNDVIGEINVGKFPTDIAINPLTQLVYVVNEDSENLSLIDAVKKTIITGVKFEINPLSGGYIVCNAQKISNFTELNYIRYPYDNELDCLATPNKGYQFAFWSGNLANDRPESHIKLKTTQFGNLKANFSESTSVDFNIPFDTLVEIILIVITAIVGWLIPSIISFINNLRQRPLLINYVKLMNKATNKSALAQLRKEIIDIYAKGKLSESNFNLLNDRLGELIENYGDNKSNI